MGGEGRLLAGGYQYSSNNEARHEDALNKYCQLQNSDQNPETGSQNLECKRETRSWKGEFDGSVNKGLDEAGSQQSRPGDVYSESHTQPHEEKLLDEGAKEKRERERERERGWR